MTSFLRPDEMAAQSEIDRARSRDKNIKSGLKTAATAGLAGAGIASKVAPFLSEYLPLDLAVKGINKVSPKLGEFLTRGKKLGLDLKEGLDFIKENTGQKSTQKNQNIVEQYSPELNQYIKDHIQQGKSALEAGARAHMKKEYKTIIEKMEKEHKTPWSAILQTAYGNQGEGQQQMAQSNAPTIAREQLGGQSQSQQPGEGQQALMSILQKIQQMRGGAQ